MDRSFSHTLPCAPPSDPTFGFNSKEFRKLRKAKSIRFLNAPRLTGRKKEPVQIRKLGNRAATWPSDPARAHDHASHGMASVKEDEQGPGGELRRWEE